MTQRQVKFNIYQELDSLNETAVSNILQFVLRAHAEIINNNYVMGNRQILREIILAEEKEGATVTKDKVKKLKKILNMLDSSPENHEMTYEEAIGLVAVFNQSAEGILEARAEQQRIDTLMTQLAQGVVQNYSMSHQKAMKQVGYYLQALGADCYTDQGLATFEKIKSLEESVAYADGIHLLLNGIMKIKLEYEVKNVKSEATKNPMIIDLDNFVNLVMDDFINKKIDHKQFFYKVWSYIDKMKGDSSGDKNAERFLSTHYKSVLGAAIETHILTNKILKELAIQSKPIEKEVKHEKFSPKNRS